MSLPPETTRCMGLIPTPFSEMRCTRRKTCARFLERYADGVQRIVLWMCPGKDDYWESYVKSAAAPSAETT